MHEYTTSVLTWLNKIILLFSLGKFPEGSFKIMGKYYTSLKCSTHDWSIIKVGSVLTYFLSTKFSDNSSREITTIRTLSIQQSFMAP
jgi:hypothetical protein